MKRKILVTGANGQLGCEIRDLAPETGHQFVFTDIDQLDMSSKDKAEAYLSKISPDYIINCAAYTAVDDAESHENEAMIGNAGIPEILIGYAKQTDTRIIHISTDYVFPGNKKSPLTETDETGPASVYGNSKLQGEKIISSYEHSMIIRTSWLYSSYGRNFVKTMFRLIEERKELRIVNDQKGSPTYAKNLAEVILKFIGNAGDADVQFRPGIYHYANTGSVTWYELTMEIRSYLNSDCKVFPIETKDYPLPAPRPMYSVMSTKKIKKDLGINIPGWKESLIECLDKLYGKNSFSYGE